MAGFFGTVVGVLLFCIFALCLWKFIYTAPRAWKRRNEGGFWAAMNAVAKEDRERFLAKQQAKAMSKGKHSRCIDHDPDTGEVFDETDETLSRSQALERWEASLVRLWEGSEEIEFTYESSSGRVRRKVTLKAVLRNEKFNAYLRGFCHLRCEERTFSAYSIVTKVLIKGKRYEIEDFLSERLGIADKDLGWE
jgi:hypothetical protein